MQVLTADRALVGADLRLVEDAAVIIDDGEITWVGPRGEAPGHRGRDDGDARHLGDVTLLPGLIDAHTHLAFDGGPEPVRHLIGADEPALVASMLYHARNLLSVGVTTARDLGAPGYLDVAVREAIARGIARGPRLVVSGPPITITGGHCWFMGGEADSADDVRTMVRRHHKHGTDLIKVMVTGGNMTTGSAPWQAQFHTDTLRVIVEEAHRVGKKVAAHAHAAEGIRRAVDAGVDTIEHCSFQNPGGGFDLDDVLVDRIVAAGIHVAPTVNFRLPDLLRMMPDPYFPVGDLYRRGVRIIAGTDAGIDHTPHHGFVGGLQALSGFDVPAHEVLIAATSRAAEAIGLGARTGQLTPGYAADLIAVPGDPRTDLGVLTDLRLIMTDGQPFTPDPLPPIPPLPEDYLPMNLRAASD